ncbi:glycoside hydrolase family 9 protein [Hirschia baltica]|uniref:glycoside hydrolase family 9 protein n=1 Tax=Hirschia baltica TaxID=2724 RepID=UPI00131EE576|nr:glycoside hydrolase family 9 protein [Hirschia baltica]
MKFHIFVAGSVAFIAALTLPNAVAAPIKSTDNCPNEKIEIFLNQVGYETPSNKSAVVSSKSTSPLKWTLKDGSGESTLSGETIVLGLDKLSGLHTHRISFSSLKTEGKDYTLETCGETSEVFKIASNPFNSLSEEALRFFYQMRSGTPILEAYTSTPEYSRPAGHPSSNLTCFNGLDRTKKNWDGCDYSLDVTGGWYDAGDYGKYVVNGGISLWTLQNAYERMSILGGANNLGWSASRVPLPEEHKGWSPLLSETRWEMEFLLKMQLPEGYQTQAPLGLQNVAKGKKLEISQIDGGGLAHHKVHEDQWLGLPISPNDSNEQRYLYPVSTAATLNLAATASQCARIWKKIDAAFSNKCLNAAKKAYTAAKAYPDIYAYDLFDGGGPYADSDLSDEFAWAAFELFSTTGNTEYIQELKDTPGRDWLSRYKNEKLNGLYWASTDILPLLTILISVEHFGLNDRKTASEAILKIADSYLFESNNNSFLIPVSHSEFDWGSNGALLNKAMILAYAGEITENSKYRNAVIDIMNYLLGNNPLSQSYIAGFGSNPAKNMHHRFWAAAADDQYPYTAPGSVSGGPNVNSAIDEVAQELLKSCKQAPITCWVDDIKAYSLNEVAINWNAPLVWVTSYLETSRGYASTN